MWESLAIRVVRDHEIAGSNPATQTDGLDRETEKKTTNLSDSTVLVSFPSKSGSSLAAQAPVLGTGSGRFNSYLPDCEDFVRVSE